MDKYSNIVDIPPILSTLKDYVIIKKAPEFPNYYDFDDIDIFCLNPQEFVQKLIMSIKYNHDQPSKLTMIEKDYNIHIDIWPLHAHRLNLRFDVYKRFPYDKFRVSHEYYQKIIQNAKRIQYQSHDIQVPDTIDDFAVRFFEWIEHPAKTKHLNYIKNNCRNKEELIETIKKYSDIKDSYLKDLEDK